MTHDETPAQWQQRLLKLIEEAIELPAEHRAEFINDRCGDDRRLREEAALLLAMEAEATNFLPESLSKTEPYPLTDRGTQTASRDDADEELLGSRFGKYLLVEKLGRGGMGIVWRAEDLVLRRDVAIKLLPPGLAEDSTASRRFLREARAAAKISHPNAVTIHDFGRDNDRLYLAMELIRGASLEKSLAEVGSFPWQHATEVTLQICSALEAAHAAGVIHRDIKPGNILLSNPSGDSALPAATDDLAAKLADFGISKSLNEVTHALTGHANTVGTPAFMSPEQARGESLDARSDLYSLGATFYIMLTGRAPFVRDDALQLMFAHCDAPIPDPCVEVKGIPAACRAVIERSLAKVPEDRYQSATEFRDGLRELLVHSPPPAESISGESPFVTSKHETAGSLTDAERGASRRKQLGILAGSFLAITVVTLLATLPWWSVRQQPAGNTAGEESFSAASLGFLEESETTRVIELDGKLGSLAVSRDLSNMAWAMSEGEVQHGRVIMRSSGPEANTVDHLLSEEYSTPTSMDFLGKDTFCAATRSRVLHIAPDSSHRNQSKVTELLTVTDGTCYTLAVDSENRRLAIASHIWADKSSRLEIATLIAGSDSLRVESRREVELPTTDDLIGVSFSNNGEYMAASDNVGNVHVIDPDKATVMKTLALTIDNPDPSEVGHGLTFSHDRKWLAAGGGNAVHLWEVGSWDLVELPAAHTGTIMSVAFSSDDRRLVSGSADGIRLWDLGAMKQIGPPLKGHDSTFVTFLRFTDNGNGLISAGFDNRIRWRMLTAH